MKKLTLSVVAAGITAASVGAYAAVPTGAAPFQVVVPNLKSGVTLNLEGLYVQPTNSDLNYSTAKSIAGSTTFNNLSSVKPQYDFGFRAGLGYIFPSSGNDVQFNWTHFDHNTSDSTVFTNTSNRVETDSSDVNFKYDALDLDVGQYLSIGTRLQTRLFVGVRGIQLKNDVSNSYADSVSTDSASLSSKFTGVGPRLGIDTSYHVSNCFGVAAHFATALLVGTVETGGNYYTGGSTATNNIYTTDDQIRVVPAFDAKLGVDYSIPFKNNTSSMTIEAGYQVTQLVDVVDRIHTFSDTGVTTSSSSVGFNGPYLSLNVKL